MKQGHRVATLSFVFFLLGYLQPSAVLLNVPFGLAFFIADAAGLWHPGPAWIDNHRTLALFCSLAWPLLVATLFSYTTLRVASALSSIRSEHVRLYVVIFVVTVFALILAVRADPGSVPSSFHGYWTSNY